MCPTCSTYPVLVCEGIESFMQIHLLCPCSSFTTYSIWGSFFFLLPGILDTAIVDQGRNVVSGSRDGTARLWDCGRSACLGVIADCGSSINGVAVGTADNSINLGSPEQMPSELITVYEFILFPYIPSVFALVSPFLPRFLLLCSWYFHFYHKINICCISTMFLLLWNLQRKYMS